MTPTHFPAEARTDSPPGPYTHFVGVDVAKATLALHVVDAAGAAVALATAQIPNALAAVDYTLREILRACGAETLPARARVLVACEHTGRLSAYVVAACRALGLACWRCDAVVVARAAGARRRGKSDGDDARDIAAYARRYAEQARPEPTEARDLARRAAARRLEFASGARRGLVKARASLKAQLTELDAFAFGAYLDPGDACARGLRATLEAAVRDLDARVAEADVRLAEAAADAAIAAEVAIARSCPGVGPVLAARLAVATHGFTRMREARKLAAHACVAPFSRTSGTSVRGRPRTSKQGDGELKTLLTMAALSCVRHREHYRAYYDRKRAAGKRHLVIVNAVRNKILHAVCACLRDGVTYDEKRQVTT